MLSSCTGIGDVSSDCRVGDDVVLAGEILVPSDRYCTVPSAGPHCSSPGVSVIDLVLLLSSSSCFCFEVDNRGVHADLEVLVAPYPREDVRNLVDVLPCRTQVPH